MDDGDSQSLGLIVLMQLLFVAILMFGLFSFFSTAFSENRLLEQLYTVDNALVAEAMQTEAHGTMQLLYLYQKPYYVTLERTRVQLSAEPLAGITRRFSVREDIDTIESRAQSRLLRWQRTPTALSISSLALADSCPTIEQLPNINTIQWSGQHIFATSFALRDALGQFQLQGVTNNIQRTTQAPTTGVYIAAEGGPGYVIRHGEGAFANRFGCFINQEIGFITEDTIELRVDASLGENHLILELPQIDADELRQLQQAVGNAAIRTVRARG